MSATLIPGSPTQRNLPISRISRACEACRARKVRCNGESPCARCRGTNRHCEYRSARSETRSTRKPLKVHNTPRPRPSGVLPSTAPVRNNDPVHFKRQRELRAGIGVSNVDTGSFQYYGKQDLGGPLRCSFLFFLVSALGQPHPSINSHQPQVLRPTSASFNACTNVFSKRLIHLF